MHDEILHKLYWWCFYGKNVCEINNVLDFGKLKKEYEYFNVESEQFKEDYYTFDTELIRKTKNEKDKKKL